MTTTNYHAINGTTPSLLWLNVPSAFDGNTNTSALYAVGYGTSNPDDYLVTDTWTLDSSTPLIVDTITKVELGYRAYEQNANVILHGLPVFNGTTDGDATIVSGPTSYATHYVDITNDPNAPATWTWDDIANLESKVWCQSVDVGKNYYVGIIIFWKRVTHEPTVEPYLIRSQEKDYNYNITSRDYYYNTLDNDYYTTTNKKIYNFVTEDRGIVFDNNITDLINEWVSSEAEEWVTTDNNEWLPFMGFIFKFLSVSKDYCYNTIEKTYNFTSIIRDYYTTTLVNNYYVEAKSKIYKYGSKIKELIFNSKSNL